MAKAAVEKGLEMVVVEEAKTLAISETSAMVKILVIVFFFFMMFFCFFLLLPHVVIFAFKLIECRDGVLKEFGRCRRKFEASSLSFGNSITVLQGGIESVRVTKACS